MTAAKEAGIDVPDGFWLSDDGMLFVVNRFRFDVVSQGGETVQHGFEDLCQLMGKTSMGKYEGSYENVIKAIALYGGAGYKSSAKKFFEYLSASILMRNGDAHLKNFGMIYSHPRAGIPVIAPLYDLTTTSVYAIGSSGFRDETMALKLNGDRRYPSREALIRFGREKCDVKNPEEIIARIAESMMRCAQTYGDLLDAKFRSDLFERWSAALKSFGFNWSHQEACTHSESKRNSAPIL